MFYEFLFTLNRIPGLPMLTRKKINFESLTENSEQCTTMNDERDRKTLKVAICKFELMYT